MQKYISYSDLLRKKEWITVRKQILKRDKLECQICKNLEIQKHSQKGEIIELSKKTSLLEVLNRSDPRFGYEYEVVFFDSTKNKHTSQVYAFYDYKEADLKSFTGAEIHFQNARNLDFINSNHSYLIVTCIEDLSLTNRWFYVNQLQVHHSFYDSFKNPWEYPLNSLKTLCWICHKKIHSL